MRRSSHLRPAELLIAVCIALFYSWHAVCAQDSTVIVRAVIQRQSATKQDKVDRGKVDESDVVVWLRPLDQPITPVDASSRKRWQLIQHDKMFQPHVLVVPVGAVVQFPNHDPFFHNVFSLFDGKRFDLGLYEAGATNSVRFDRLGVSFLFCNIHSDMSAVVVAVDTNYFGISGKNGYITLANVPEGKYELHVWYERSLPEDLKGLTRVVAIASPTADLGAVNIPENPNFSPSHKNKYGQDYTPPSTPSYSHQ